MKIMKPPITCAVLETNFTYTCICYLNKEHKQYWVEEKKQKNIKCKQDETRRILTNYNNY